MIPTPLALGVLTLGVALAGYMATRALTPRDPGAPRISETSEEDPRGTNAPEDGHGFIRPIAENRPESLPRGMTETCPRCGTAWTAGSMRPDPHDIYDHICPDCEGYDPNPPEVFDV